MQERCRRRILVLTPRDPYPTIGGDRLRIQRLARELSKRYDLTLLTLCSTSAERDAPLPDDGVFKEVHRILLPMWRSLLNVAKALPRSEPLQIAYYRSHEFQEAVHALAPKHHVVLAHLIRTGQYIRSLPTVRVLEMTDAISMNMARTTGTTAEDMDLRRLAYRIEAKRLATYERELAQQCDLSMLTSAVDAAYLFGGKAAESNVIVVPNGCDLPGEDMPPLSQRSRHEIAFLGNLHALQNFDAVWFFARHVLPRVREQRPQLVLRVIGPIRRRAARKLRKLPGVRVEGVVPDLKPLLSQVRIGICPVRMSAGVQNKILDYFAHRMAVISSSNGSEALDARSGEHLLLADTPQQWVAQTLRLLDDELLAQRLADAGRDLVRARHRWERCVQPMLDEIDGLLEGSANEEESAPATAMASVV